MTSLKSHRKDKTGLFSYFLYLFRSRKIILGLSSSSFSKISLRVSLAKSPKHSFHRSSCRNKIISTFVDKEAFLYKNQSVYNVIGFSHISISFKKGGCSSSSKLPKYRSSSVLAFEDTANAAVNALEIFFVILTYSSATDGHRLY